MSRFADLIFQGGSAITMIVLELLCFYLIINFNSSQREIWLETVSVYTGSVNENIDGLNTYVGLREQVDSLRSQLAAYKTAAEGRYLFTAASVDSVRDDSLRQRFVYLAAEVVNKSPYGPNNTCIINRGSEQGVETGQGVVSDLGVLGIITAVGKNHARVMSLLHRDVRLTAGLRSNYFGTLRWDGKDPRVMILNDLKSYVPVAIGDTVFTTSYSSIFPTDLPIGRVKTTEKLLGTGNWRIEIDLLGEPLRMRYVYVIKDLFKEDIAPLMESAQ